MADRSKEQEFSEEETQRRFDAALRGARTAGHKPMSEMRQGKIEPKKASDKKRQKRNLKR